MIKLFSECASPPTIANGVAQFDNNNTVKKTEGTELQYTCDTGHARNGQVICQANGQWSTMTCIRVCPAPPFVANSVQRFDPTTVTRAIGTQLQYACLPGNVPEPEGNVTCQDNGQWTGKSCLRVCPEPPSVPNGYRVSYSVNGSYANGTYVEGDEVEFNCTDEFVPLDLINKISCQPNGTWNFVGCTTCHTPPKIMNTKTVFSDPRTYFDGEVLELNCSGGYIAENLTNKITCQSDSSWTSMRCIPIQSCSQVHQCDTSFTDDDYWIYVPAFGGNRAKIYCDDLNGTATEYVSLPVPNVGEFPNSYRYRCSTIHYGRYSSSQYPGRTRYNKIAINIETMEVNRTDVTYADQIFGYRQNYGEAKDCYTPHFGKAWCGPKGRFNIDLTGTGLKVDSQLQFHFYGWKYWGEAVWSAGDTKIDLLCGGWNGGCRPIGPLILRLKSFPEPPEESAIMPNCVYP